jgi:hypothetical protein
LTVSLFTKVTVGGYLQVIEGKQVHFLFIVGRAYHQKSPLIWTAYLWNCMSHTSEIWICEVIFVVFRLMKNIIFNKTESFVGRNTSDHACQIVCSKSNCETINLVLNIFTVEVFFTVCFNHAVIWLKNNLTGSKARLNMFAPC